MKEKILDETNKYATQKNTNFVLSVANVNKFNAILMFKGYYPLPRTGMFLEEVEYVDFALVYKVMRIRNFEEYKRYIHNFVKVRKSFDITNKSSKKFDFFHTYYSFDKRLVQYTYKRM